MMLKSVNCAGLALTGLLTSLDLSRLGLVVAEGQKGLKVKGVLGGSEEKVRENNRYKMCQ